MLSKMRNPLAFNHLQVSDLLTAWPPALDEEEKETKATWAKRVQAYADVPEVYRDFFEPLEAQGIPFPYTVLTPTYAGFPYETTQKLVCMRAADICILEASGAGYALACYPFAEISYVEVCTVLLDSVFKVVGVTRQGERVESSFRYNTVSGDLFEPILTRIRLETANIGDTVRRSQVNKFDNWAKLNFKFMHYARRSVLAGERVLSAILQPEIRVCASWVMDKTHQSVVCMPHATILTDRELIVIREEQRGVTDKYGGLWNYIPLDKINALSLGQWEDDLLMLTIDLPGEESLAYLFQPVLDPHLRKLLDKFLKVKGG